MGTVPRNKMHDIAYEDAVKKGPRVVVVGNEQLAAYSLTKKELAALFE